MEYGFVLIHLFNKGITGMLRDAPHLKAAIRNVF